MKGAELQLSRNNNRWILNEKREADQAFAREFIRRFCQLEVLRYENFSRGKREALDQIKVRQEEAATSVTIQISSVENNPEEVFLAPKDSSWGLVISSSSAKRLFPKKENTSPSVA